MTVSWRWLALAVLTPLGILYALPNLYPPAPAVQVGWASPDVNIEGLRQEINEQLAQADIPLLSLESESQSLLTTFADSEQQLHAQKVLQNYFSGRAEVALNLADRTPGWLAQLGASAMKLGLDLRGGVYFLMEIDRASLLNDRLNARVPEIKRHLRDNRIRWRNLEVKQGQLYIEAARAEDRPLLQKLVTGEFTDLVRPEAQLASQGLYFVFTEPAVTEMLDSALKQNLSALRNRIDSLGVSEPVVRQEGVGRIAIELPGIQDTAAARRIIGRTATLEFRLEAEGDTPLSRREVFNFKDSTQGAAVLLNTVVTTGEHVVSARSSFDENGLAIVAIQLDAEGGERMFNVTRNNLGRRMGTLLIESLIDPVTGERQIKRELLTLPSIRGTFGSNFQIEGVGSAREASELSLLLRSGALAAPMNFLTERVIGPTLGAENIRAGFNAMLLGLCLVCLFMLLRYRYLGLIANIALILNLTFVVALMSLLGATLTLPGIAGLVLTVGMAVDANVLIFERIREERAAGRSPYKALTGGYDQALVTIIDANLTTLLAAIILYSIGTGPIRGFSITLALGILTSMFTAVTATRAMAGAGIKWAIPEQAALLNARRAG